MLRTNRGPYPLDPYAGTSNLERSRSIGLTPGAQDVTRPRGLTAVILNLDRPDLILPAIDRMAEVHDHLVAHNLGFELVIGDTGSADPEVLARYSDAPDWLTVVAELDYQFSRSNNESVTAAPVGFDHLMLLNNDVVLPSAAPVVELMRVLDEDPAAAVAGLCLQFPDGTVQHAGVDIVGQGFRRGLPWHPLAGSVYRPGPARYPALAVTGACLMIRRSVWDAVGGLDEQYTTECQDVDLCLAVRRLGWGVHVVDAGRVVHYENATRDKDDGSLADRRLFVRRWGSFLEALRP